MLLNLAKIPKSGLKLLDQLSLESLNARLQAGAGSDIQFTLDPKIELFINQIAGGFNVKSKIATEYTQPCGRCAEVQTVSLSFDYNFSLVKELDQTIINQDQVGVIYYQNHVLDIKEQLEEQIILKLTPYLLPKIDNKENCSLCHKKIDYKDIKDQPGKHAPFEILKKIT